MRLDIRVTPLRCSISACLYPSTQLNIRTLELLPATVALAGRPNIAKRRSNWLREVSLFYRVRDRAELLPEQNGWCSPNSPYAPLTVTPVRHRYLLQFLGVIDKLLDDATYAIRADYKTQTS